MKLLPFLIYGLLFSLLGQAQNFELLDRQEGYLTGYNQLVRIQLKIRNNSDKAQLLLVKKTKGDLSESQKGYFCLDGKCLESSINEFSKKTEPGEIINLNYTVESGTQQALSNFRFEISPKGSSDLVEHNVSLTVDDHIQRSLYQSKEITINEVYPNPVQDQAVIDYKVHDDLLKARIVVHNILGRSMAEYELTANDSRVKMQMDDFAPGVYFYTLYVDNSAVLTRKIMVRK